MITLFEKEIVIKKTDEKTNLSFDFTVENNVTELEITYFYSPKILDGSPAFELAKACIERDAGCFEDSYESPSECLPLKNLITLSLDDPFGYRGAAHRQADNQIHRISEDYASPGFSKGEIPQGKWKITLNVHAVVTDEVKANIIIKGKSEEPENKLYPCELHCHTVHSDGTFTPESLVRTAEERQLAGINLTDHNTMSGYSELPQTELAVVKGVEWTTYFGHMLVLGCSSFVDWRDAVPENIDMKMKQVRDAGGLVGMAHPYQLGTPICTGGHWDFKVKDFSLVNYLEVWSEGHPCLSAANERAIRLWHSLLDKGHRITPTFGRDWHNGENDKIPTACTFLLSHGKLTPEKMLSAIKNGKTVVSAGFEFVFETEDGKTIGDEIQHGKHTFTFKISKERINALGTDDVLEAEEIRLVSNGGIAVASTSPSESEITLETMAGRWYSAELWGTVNGVPGQMLALTSPIYSV